MIMYDFLVMRFFRDAGFYITYDYGACEGFRIPSTPEFLLSFCVFVLSRGCVCVSVLNFFLRDSYFKLINHKLLLFEFMWKEGKEWFCIRLIVYLLEYMVCCIWDHHDFIIDRGLSLVCRQIYLELMYDIKNNGVFFVFFGETCKVGVQMRV